MLTLPPFPPRLGGERGFTLIETLVAMLTGIIVTGALFAILEFSVRQTSYISQTAQATQVSRTAMTHIVDELHSACLSSGFSPVQEGSSATLLKFQDGYSEEAEVPGLYTAKGGSTKERTEGVRQDQIEWNEAKGTLTDLVRPGTGAEEGGKYPVAAESAGTPVRLALNVTPAESANSKGETGKWLFRYYEYAGSSSTNTAAAATTLKEIPLTTAKPTLGTTEAEKVASVEVRFKTGSYTKEVKVSKAQESTIPSELLTQTTFAFSAPNSEATIQAGPCE
jgi:type II secretory pathway pseudopilin PulG